MKRIEVTREELSYNTTEELNTLRTNIRFAGVEKKIILVTSCLAGEGKSQIVFNLASSMAELGKKVLLIDADMRKSVMVSNVKEGTVDRGLSHYLSGQCNLADAVYRTNIPGLHLLFAGPVPPNPTELLSAELFKQTMDPLRELYDYIIVDSAPLGLVVDAAIIAQCCDASILVIESGVVKYKFAQSVKEKLEATGCPMLGAVLNKVDRKKTGKYYGKYYKKYYGNEYENHNS